MPFLSSRTKSYHLYHESGFPHKQYEEYIFMTNMTHRAARSRPPLHIWQVQLDQTYVKGAEGALEIKWIEITPQQLRFYYVFTSNHSINLRVVASSALPTESSDATIVTLLATTVQTLGRLGSYEVGVAQVEHRSQSGQTITLAITLVPLSGTSVTTWRLAPLKQLRPEPHVSTTRSVLRTNSNELSEAQWYGPVMAQLVSYATVILPGQLAADRSHVFVRSDDPVVVAVITEPEYLAFAGLASFTP